ncbi:MAG: PD40 domain-containing protein [Bacteroidales bacterium]|nr:MAG: PD40 domain-containing protein [Bacteroidales bacterium]
MFYQINALSQSSTRNKFFEADYALQLNDYETALKLFKQLLKRDPDNALYNYRVGQCILNLQDSKKEALLYLEFAVQSVSEKFKEGNFSERNSPTETYFLLAKAYHLNEDLDNAVYYYNSYLPYTEDKSRISYVNNQIRACELAKISIKNPVTIKTERLDAPINSESSEIYPVVSDDESILIYLERRDNNNIVYYSVKEGGKWTKPVNINKYIGSIGDSYPSSISNDNSRLYLTVKDYFTSTICYSEFSNGKWTKMKKLKKPVNSKSWNSQAFESVSGNELYFVSDRKGGYGGLDIYKSVKNKKGQWDKPENLGSTINTELNEIMPIISPDGNEFYFCSEGHTSIGGYDVFMSARNPSNTWSDPVNLGYPMNTTDDDVYFRPVSDGIFAYNSLPRPDDLSNYDIYRIEINPEPEIKQEEITLLSDVEEPVYPDQPETESQDEITLLSDMEEPVYPDQPETESQDEITLLSDKEETVYPDQPETESIPAHVQLYTIQLMALKNPVRADYFSDMSGIIIQVGNDGFYRYITGQFNGIYEAESGLIRIKSSGYNNAFIRKLNLSQYLSLNTNAQAHSSYEPETSAAGNIYTIQIMALRNPVAVAHFEDLRNVKVSYGSDRLFRYTYKEFSSIGSAETNLKIIRDKGYKGAFIRKITDISKY